MTTTLITGGVVIDAASGTADEADLLIENGRIVNVGKKLQVRTENSLDAAGCVILPGLINAHTHAHNTLTRGAAQRWTLESLLLRGPSLQAGRTWRDHYLSAAVSVIEMLHSGCTTAFDTFSSFPVASMEQVEATAAAYKDVGIRAVIAPLLTDIPLLATLTAFETPSSGALKAAICNAEAIPPEGLLSFTRAVHDEFHETAGGRLLTGIAPAIPTQCSDDFLSGCSRLAQEKEMIVQTHLAESKIQAVTANRRWGQTATRHLDQLGLVNGRLVAAHGVWLSTQDMNLLGSKEATVVYNPASNLRLGSGIPPVREFLDSGINVALGTDGSVSSDNQNILAAMYIAGLLGGSRYPYDAQRWLSSEEVLTMATTGGAHALGRAADLGRAQVGNVADLSIIGVQDASCRPTVDVANTLVFAGARLRVQSVLVDGEIVLDEGKTVAVNEKAIVEEAHEAAIRLWYDNSDSRARAEALDADLQAFLRDFQDEPLPGNRHLD